MEFKISVMNDIAKVCSTQIFFLISKWCSLSLVMNVKTVLNSFRACPIFTPVILRHMDASSPQTVWLTTVWWSKSPTSAATPSWAQAEVSVNKSFVREVLHSPLLPFPVCASSCGCLLMARTFEYMLSLRFLPRVFNRLKLFLIFVVRVGLLVDVFLGRNGVLRDATPVRPPGMSGLFCRMWRGCCWLSISR